MSTNPFSMSFGIEPNNYISRNNEINIIENTFISEYPSNYVYLITGVRGSGKTVLLSNVSDIFRKKDEWIVINPTSKANLLESIASEIYENAGVKKLFLKKSISFSFHGLSLSLSGSTPVSSVATLIKKMLQYLKEEGKRVLITIDEVDNSQEMRTFCETYQNLLREKYPVFLLMTGLYDNIFQLQDNKSLTFLYRAPKLYLKNIDLRRISYSYSKLLNIDISDGLNLAKITKGYAYAFQLLGFLLFEKGKVLLDNEILMEFDNFLAEYVYDKIYSELTATEKEIVKVINTNDEVSVNSIIKCLNVDSKYFGVYRDRLIKKGIFVSNSFGFIEFALPRFKEYLLFK